MWILVSSTMVAVGSGCESKTQGPIEPTYENVGKVIERSCALSNSCHGGSGPAKARLNFDSFTDNDKPFTQALLNVPSCEYSLMPRITPGDPEQSWVFQKLTRATDPATGMILHTPAAEWDPGITPNDQGLFRPSVCPLVGRDGMISFGHVMPDSVDGSQPLEAREIEMFRQWILMGAPGPGFDAGLSDSGVAEHDSGTVLDSAVMFDSAMFDSGANADSGADAEMADAATDANDATDAGSVTDAAAPADASREDSGTDSGAAIDAATE